MHDHSSLLLARDVRVRLAFLLLAETLVVVRDAPEELPQLHRVAALDALHEATRELLDFFEDEGAARRVRVVLTRVPPSGQAGEQAREDLRDDGWTVCNAALRCYAAYQKAAELGTLCRDVRDPRAEQAWDDVLRLSREVL